MVVHAIDGVDGRGEQQREGLIGAVGLGLRGEQRRCLDIPGRARFLQDGGEIVGDLHARESEQGADRPAELAELARDDAGEALVRGLSVDDGAAEANLVLAELLLDAEPAVAIGDGERGERVLAGEEEMAAADVVVEQREDVGGAGISSAVRTMASIRAA